VEGVEDEVQGLGMLASALAGRPLTVTAADAGERSWTDGRTVFLAPETVAHEQLQTLAVQASMLAMGSLEPEIVRRLTRRPALAHRYLAVEAHRALGANRDLLPWRMRSLTDEGVAKRTDSPASSLAIAESRELIADPPASFGVIRARRLLAAERAAEKSADTGPPGRHVPRRTADSALPELDEAADEDEEVVDPFSSAVGGGGAIGKALQRLLSNVRQLGGGGPPGADAATRRRRSATPRAGAVVSSLRPAPHRDDGNAADGAGVKYPEWDGHRRRYRHDWCTVREIEASHLAEGWTVPDGHALRRALARLGMGMSHHHRQRQGDDIDIDAAVEGRVELLAGSAPDDAIYVDTLRRRRDLSVLILLDISGSAAEAGTCGQTVHDQQRSAAAALTKALHELGDRVALFAFRSQGRSDVRLTPVKRFDARFDTAAMRRLYGLEPGAYSRLGAAIRHGTAVLRDRSGTPRRLLVVLSDGLAYDHGYERVYGAADARRALAEAGRHGIGCLCLTVGASTGIAELRRVFGSAAHATVATPEQLSQVIGPLFRVALNRAESRRGYQRYVPN
jgi:nitric oxide reductase NorD protein